MKCHRCRGWMVQEKYYGAGLPFWGWRCVFCGDILDSVIWQNRSLRRRLPPVQTREALAEGRGR
jgi:hypothetical protein